MEQPGRRLQLTFCARLLPRQVRAAARFRRSATTWIIGADLGWNPVTNLNFDLELMYQSTNQADAERRSSGRYTTGARPNQFFVPGAWQGNSSGFAGRFRITRYF